MPNSEELLRAALFTLNRRQNFGIGAHGFKDSYELAGAIQKHLEKLEGQPDWEAFGRQIFEESWPTHHDVEGNEIFDAAKKHRLIREAPGGYNPEVHEDSWGDSEPGDPWFLKNYPTS